MGVILRYKDFIKTYKTRGYRIKHLEYYKRFFPIKSSTVLSSIIADVICDGNLQGDPKWRMDFTSKSTKELKRFEGNIKFLFNIRGRIRRCESNIFGKTYNIAINCSPITRIVYLCGAPVGQKVLINFGIPKWIIQNKENFRYFSRRVFSCEGYVMHEKNRKIPQIRLEMWKSDQIRNRLLFMNGLKWGLKKFFKINSKIILGNRKNVRKDKIITRPIRMYLFGKDVINFYNEIGFEGAKQKILKTHLTS